MKYMLHKNKGIMTILVTSLLLLFSLMITLMSYKRVYYQLRQTRSFNQKILQHWQRKSAMSCLYAINKANPFISLMSQNYQSCDAVFSFLNSTKNKHIYQVFVQLNDEENPSSSFFNYITEQYQPDKSYHTEWLAGGAHEE